MYWIISIIVLIPFSIMESVGNNKQKNIIRFFCFFVFLLIITGSYFNGVDWINYIKHYQYISKYSIDSPLAFVYEPGFVYVTWIFAYILNINNYYVIPFLCNLFFAISLFFSLKKIPVRINLSLYLILLLIFLSSLFNDGYRQLISISILLPFLFSIDKVSFLKWASICLISALFHASSILLIPFWLIFRINFTNKNIILSFFCAIVFVLVLSNLLSILQLFSNFIPTLLFNKINYYISSAEGNFRFGLFVIFDFLGIIICVLKKPEEKNKLLWNVLFIYFLCHFCFYFTPFFQRLLFYFYPILILYVFDYKKSLSYFILSLIILSIGVLSFIRYITNPYYSSDFWEPKFFYSYIVDIDELDIYKLELEKCSVINHYDDNFCR